MKKRVAVITGASRGIGKVTLDLLQKQGFQTVALSRTLRNTRYSRACDVRDEDSVKKVFKDILANFGRIDVLVNCAGLVSPKKSLELQASDWDEMLGVNLMGTYFCCKYALLAMVRQQYGKIVNISSKAGRGCSRTASLAYTCSKYGVIGLTRQLAAEFARSHININCVCPSQVNTEMLKVNVPKAMRDQLLAGVPMGRFAEPREIAHAIAFLVNDEASYVNGAILDVNGAQI